MPKQPVIGLTTYGRNEKNEFTLPIQYSQSVLRAGGLPILIPTGPLDEELIRRYLSLCDGFILTGGGDLDPKLYAGQSHQSVYMIDEDRDCDELEFTRSLIKQDIPTLAICRGMQVLNVTLGGTLYEHLPDDFGEEVTHRLPPREPVLHRVTLDQQSNLSQILNTTACEVMSWHHQAIRKVGEGLTISARAEDGVIEALDKKDHHWLYAVQWHPELTAATDSTQQSLFDELVNVAAKP